MSGALIVFAKRPEPGRVKTRMCPPLTAEEAAEFYAAMLDDVLEASAVMARGAGLEPILAIDPPDAVAAFEARMPDEFRVLPQRGSDLSARMERAAADAFQAGFAPVLLRGSDSPAMQPETVSAACEALTKNDLVLCPDLDGGYNLVGLARPAPGVFDHPMSRSSVLEDTLSLAEARGLCCATLPPGFDIDTADDLAHLRQAFSEGENHHFSRTIHFLSQHRLWVD